MNFFVAASESPLCESNPDPSREDSKPGAGTRQSRVPFGVEVGAAPRIESSVLLDTGIRAIVREWKKTKLQRVFHYGRGWGLACE
jgi:hypothetical protein